MRVKDKIALITGAGSGIGRSTAVLFAKEGAKVIVVDCDSKSGNETVNLIRREHGEAVFVRADVSKAAEVEEMVRTAVRNYGKLDILFNNAGIVEPGLLKSVVDLKEEEWDRIVDINLKSVFLASKYAFIQMMKNGGGVIINTGSTYGLVGDSNWSAYCASKGGVVNLTRALSAEGARYGIRVNCICPGGVDTPMGDRIYSAYPDPQLARQKEIESHGGRIAKPEDIASAALYLASDESAFVSGAVLPVDGGYTAR